MPAARVKLLELDTSTRRSLIEQGVSSEQPVAFINAAPYRADCRTIVWTDATPFAVRGEVGFVRASLAPRSQWIDGVPVLVIPDAWNYPYPRRRGLATGVASAQPLASAEALFRLTSALERPIDVSGRPAVDSVKRVRAMAWAGAEPGAYALEPARTMVRRAVLDPDWERARSIRSRLRGTYRVDLEVGGEQSTWFFRSHDRPGYMWNADDSLQSAAQLIASPHVLGYRLVGLTALSRDALPDSVATRTVGGPLVWLSTADRPTAAGNDARRDLATVLEFNLAAAPERVWNDLEAFVPPMSALDSAFFARLNRPLPRGQRQPRLPLTLHLDASGRIAGDTLLLQGPRAIRVIVTRLDTLSVKRPF
jgi:hypothetical protein